MYTPFEVVYGVRVLLIDEAINGANLPSPTQARRDPGQITDHTHTQTTDHLKLRPDSSLSPYRRHFPTIRMVGASRAPSSPPRRQGPISAEAESLTQWCPSVLA